MSNILNITVPPTAIYAYNLFMCTEKELKLKIQITYPQRPAPSQHFDVI